MYIPNELVNMIMLYSSSSDIRRWENFERLDRTLYLKNKHSDIIEACEDGNIVGVKYLIEKQNVSMYKINSCFLASCDSGHLHIIKYLVENCRLNVQYNTHKALDIVSRNGNVEILKYIFEFNHIRDTKLLSNSTRYGHLDVFIYLLDMGYDIYLNETMLHESILYNHKNILEHVAVYYTAIYKKLLIKAAIYDHVYVIKFVLANKLQIDKHEILKKASYNCSFDVVRCIVDDGIVDISVHTNSKQISEYLDMNGIINYKTKEKGFVKYLELNRINDFIRLEGMVKCYFDHKNLKLLVDDNPHTIKFLIDYGLNINYNDFLIWAFQKKCIEIALCVIENAEQLNYNRALTYCYHNKKLAQALILKGADIHMLHHKQIENLDYDIYSLL
jgi:hypothetical protein